MATQLHPWMPVPESETEQSLDFLRARASLADHVARAFEDRGYTCERRVTYHPYVSTRADLLASRETEAVLVIVRLLPETARVSIDDGQQAQYCAHLYDETHPRAGAPPTKVLLVTTGRLSSMLRTFAEDRNHGLYLATPDALDEALDRIQDEPRLTNE